MDMLPKEYKKMKALHSRAEKIGKPAFRKEMAKKMKKEKTYMGRPIEELEKEAGIGKYKGRYE